MRPAPRATARPLAWRLAILLPVLLLGARTAGAQTAPDGGATATSGAAATSGSAAPNSGAAAHVEETPDEMINRGVDLRRHGDDQGALPVLRAAYQRGKSPRAAAQLGFVEQALGIWVDAESHLVEAAAAATDPWVAEHATLLEESLAFVRRHIGELVVESKLVGSEISVDGLLVGRTPLPAPLRIAAGDRWIEARTPTGRPFLTTVTVRAGRTSRVNVSPDPPTAAPGTAASAAAQQKPSSTAAAASTGAALLSPAATATTSAGARPEDAGSRGARDRPLYTRWWLWTGVAVVLVGIGVAVAASAGGPDPFTCGSGDRVCAR